MKRSTAGGRATASKRLTAGRQTIVSLGALVAFLALAGRGEGNAPAPARSEPPAASSGADAGSPPQGRGSTPVRTVEHFPAHPDEREAVWAACRNNPGEARTDSNRHDALDARRRAGLRERQDNPR